MPSRETPAVGRAGEDFFVGGDPLQAGVGRQRDNALADRAFRGPHAPAACARKAARETRPRGGCVRGRRRRSFPGAAAASRRASRGGPAACPRAAAKSGDRRAWWSTRSVRGLATRGAAARPRGAIPSACPAARAFPFSVQLRPLLRNSANCGSCSKASGCIHTRFDQHCRSTMSRLLNRLRARSAGSTDSPRFLYNSKYRGKGKIIWSGWTMKKLSKR